MNREPVGPGATRRRALGALGASSAALLAGSACRPGGTPPGRSPGIEGHPGARDLHALAEASRERYGLPSVAVGIVHRGRIVGLGIAGERVARSGDWATLDDAFDVASCAKSVTATIAAMLVDRGAVRWTTTLAEAFPGLPVHAGHAGVTLEQLLRHRSGLRHELTRNAVWSDWHRRHATLPPADQRLAFTRWALERPPREPPDGAAHYTSDAYVVAGALLERAAGRDWEGLARAELFEPLGLRSMRYGFALGAHAGEAVAGHEPGWFGRAVAVAHDPDEYGARPFGAPAGFLYAAVPDLLRYVDFHIQGAAGRGSLLPPSAFERLHRSPDGDGHALGWMSEARRDGAGATIEHSVHHGGYSGRFRANLWFVPETQWGTVVVTNDGRGDESIAAGIFYALLREFDLAGGAQDR